MKRLLLALALCVPLPSAAAAQSWSATLEHVAPAILHLKGDTQMGERWSCSAVVIAPGRALTAAHCVEAENVTDRVDLAVDDRAVEVVKSNRILDLAVIKFLSHGEAPLTLTLQRPKAGAEVAIIGYALGKKELHSQFGHVSQPRDEDGRFVLDVEIFHGDSGTAVIDRTGHLAAIAVSKIEDSGSSQGYAVPVDIIRDFLEGVQ